MAKIIVTGSSGFIGSYLIEYLTNRNHIVLGLDCNPPHKKNDSLKNFFFTDCNLLNLEWFKKVVEEFSPLIILHLAARTDLNEKNNLEGYAVNIEGVKNLIEVIQQVPSIKRCIFTSSQLVCKVGYIPKNDRDYNPNTLYGQSKVLTEKIVIDNDGGGIEWCIVRPTTVWGPGMGLHYQRFLKMIYDNRYFHIGKRPLYKSYSYIGNIAYQYEKLMESPSQQIHARTFYLADYEPTSLRNWANLIQKELAVKAIPTYPESIAKLAAKIGDIIALLGFENFPFNSFRLNNIITEYLFDLSQTQEVCGELPYTTEQGVKEMVFWLKSERIIA